LSKAFSSPRTEVSSGNRVAVIVVNFNGGATLARCLGSIKNQSLRPARVIVVDNASSDRSAANAALTFPEFTFLELTENLGFAAANNHAAKIADDCDWLALLNPDACAAPNWLENLYAAARRNPEFDFFGARMLMTVNPSYLDGVGDVYHVSGAHWRCGHGEVGAARYLEIVEIFAPCAAAALYRRDPFVKVGGFDESFFCYAEDVDLGFRLQLKGHRCLYVPEAVVEHVGSAITGRRSDFAVYHGHRNLVWVYSKNMPWPLFWLYLPQHILLNLISLVWFSLHGQARVIFKSKWDALKGLPRILRESRQVQASRRVSAWELRRVMAKGLFLPYFRHRMQWKSQGNYFRNKGRKWRQRE
jgi:GT2 family glycosyltransferase